MYYGSILMIKDIIKQKVKLNKHYKGNEDLLEFVVNRVIERISGVIESINDDNVVSSFLDKAVSKAFVDILKENERFGAKRLNRIQKIDYKQLVLSVPECLASIDTDRLKQFYLTLSRSDENDSTSFMQLMKLRYKDKKSLEEIASSMKISEEDVSEMLFCISDYANKVMSV